MELFLDKHFKLIANLVEAGVDFIIIGGFSVIYHGYKRITGDMDIFFQATLENKKRILTALNKIGIDNETLVQIEKEDFTQPLVFSIWEQPEKVDFINKINLVSFEEADKEKLVDASFGMNIPFLNLNHLVLSKFNTGRTKDKADIEELQKISSRKKKK